MKNRNLISVVGPTAIGKTSLSIILAQEFDAEIISADSRQFYKEMQTGTAAPSAEELNAAPHHFIHNISIKDDYSVGDFEKDALLKLDDLFKSSAIAIMVGGSGLFIKSVLVGLDDFPEIDPQIREDLNAQFEEKGIQLLQEKLQQIDPESYRSIDIQNKHRLIRALEISLGSGKPFSSFLNHNKKQRNFNSVSIGLTAPRDIIYDRINKRVDEMMDSGLLEEAQNLYPFRKNNALNTVGYKELFAFFEGRYDLEEAVSEIKKNTRRFAKRQLTWFRKDKTIKWFDYLTPPEDIIYYINGKIG